MPPPSSSSAGFAGLVLHSYNNNEDGDTRVELSINCRQSRFRFKSSQGVCRPGERWRGVGGNILGGGHGHSRSPEQRPKVYSTNDCSRNMIAQEIVLNGIRCLFHRSRFLSLALWPACQTHRGPCSPCDGANLGNKRSASLVRENIREMAPCLEICAIAEFFRQMC